MSGYGCNQESSCEDTKQKQLKNRFFKIKDLATEESESSCCDNEAQQEPNPDEKDSAVVSSRIHAVVQIHNFT